jgi:tRNA threonylcarbamoyladenosine biosynthesis protein TsaB
MPAVEALLEPLGLAVGDLGAVAVSAGPGSFTGLRVGVAAAKGLAYSLGIPLYGMPTLDLLAANAPPGTTAVRTVIDARRGELFTALYDCSSGAPEAVGEAAIVTPEQLARRLAPGTLVIGEPGASRELFARRQGVFIAPPHLAYPRAAAAALAGADRLAAGGPSETASLTPFYLRPSDAEAGRAARRKTPQ